jgi:hypothetical protein
MLWFSCSRLLGEKPTRIQESWQFLGQVVSCNVQGNDGQQEVHQLENLGMIGMFYMYILFN